MARQTKLQIVREAVEIQGYIEISVNHQIHQCRSIKVVNGEWVTDIPTADMCGYVRIKKTKPVVVARAQKIIANAEQIRAEREADAERARRSMMDS